jgi:2-keto-4-pentenoate hydratase
VDVHHPLIARLRDARASGRLIGALDDAERPGDLAQAYAIAQAVQAGLSSSVGVKIGATSARGQQMLGIAEPFWGAIPQAGVQHAPGRWPSGFASLTVDAELVLQLGTIDPAADPATWVRAVHLGLELNAPRYANPFALGGLAIIADGGAHSGLVIGPAIAVPPEDWPAISVQLLVGGAVAAEGTGAAVLGHPLEALRWLVGAAPQWGLALRPGDWVASGNLCFAVASAGQSVVADFGALGQVTLAASGEPGGG